MPGYLASVLAAAGLVTAGVAASGSVRSGEALPIIMLANGPTGAGKCAVRVDRKGIPGIADISRAVFKDGSCVCVVKTGAASKNGSAEKVVSDLLRDRQCIDAPVIPEAEAASFGPAASILPAILGAGGAGGLAAGLGASSNG